MSIQRLTARSNDMPVSASVNRVAARKSKKSPIIEDFKASGVDVEITRNEVGEMMICISDGSGDGHDYHLTVNQYGDLEICVDDYAHIPLQP